MQSFSSCSTITVGGYMDIFFNLIVIASELISYKHDIDKERKQWKIDTFFFTKIQFCTFFNVKCSNCMDDSDYSVII